MDERAPSLSTPAAGARAGVVCALVAAATFGACAPVGKDVFEGVSPMLAGGWTNVAAAICVSIALLVRPGRPEERLARADLPWVGGAAICGSLVAPWAFFVGLSKTDAHVTSLLLNLEVPMTAAIAMVLFRERLGRAGGLGVALVTAGGVVCGWVSTRSAAGESPAESGASGAAWIALACLMWALDTNFLRRVSHRDALRATRAKCAAGGLLGLVVAQATGASLLSLRWETLAWGAVYGAVGIGASVAFFVASMRRIGAARAGAIFGMHPLVGVAVSVVRRGEQPAPGVLAAACAMAAGVLLVAADAGRGRAEGPKAA